jgi:hypothetical protein
MKKKDIQLIYGATIFFKDGDKLTLGIKFLNGIRLQCQFLAEVSGKVLFEDMVVGSTVKEEVDAVTGLTHKVVIESKSKEDASKQPRIVITDDAGNPITLFQELKTSCLQTSSWCSHCCSRR